MLIKYHIPVIRAIFGLLLISFLTYYVWNEQLFLYLKNISFEWSFISVMAIIISTLIGIINIYLLLPTVNKTPFHRLLPAYWFAWAFGLVIPGQIGDLISLSTWLRRQGYQWHLSISRVLLDKLISLAVIILFSILGMILLLDVDSSIIMPASYLSIGLFFFISLLIFLKPQLRKILSNRKNIIIKTMKEFIKIVIQSPVIVITNILLSFIKFVFIGIAYWSMFHAINITNIEFMSVIMLVAASSLVAYLPISFNGLGTVEVTGVFLFSSLNIPPEAVITTYLCLRLIVLSLAWSPVILWYFFFKKI